jgi:hypothetical protein
MVLKVANCNFVSGLTVSRRLPIREITRRTSARSSIDVYPVTHGKKFKIAGTKVAGRPTVHLSLLIEYRDMRKGFTKTLQNADKLAGEKVSTLAICRFGREISGQATGTSHEPRAISNRQ